MLVVVLIVSASVLAAAVLNKLAVIMLVLKKARAVGVGAFFMSVSWLSLAACPHDVSNLEQVELASIYDGDTLRLVGGEKLRVIGINTPELAHKGRIAQPLAEQSKQLAEHFLANYSHNKLYIQRGVDTKDRYGRSLVHVYRGDGESLAAELLSKGLAWQVVVPDNTRHWQCYQQQEQQARRAGLGVWQQLPVQADKLTVASSGFQLVRGRVDSVHEGRHRWWLMLGRLAVSVSKKDQHYFDEQGLGADWRRWQGQTLQLKGWIVDRSRSRAVIERGYAPFMMSLRHPSMLVD